MVGMENHERARRRSRGFFYSRAGDDGRLGAFFIDLDHSVLLDGKPPIKDDLYI